MLGWIAAVVLALGVGVPDEPASVVTVQAGRTRVALRTDRGLRAGEVYDQTSGRELLSDPGRCPVLVMAVGDQQLRAADARVVGRSQQASGVRLRLRWAHCPVEATVGVGAGCGDETRWTLTVRNTGSETVFAKAAFPVLGGLSVGELEETSYLCPLNGGTLNYIPVHANYAYGNCFIQVTDLYDPASGRGLYLRVNDNKAEMKTFELLKALPRQEPARTFMVADDWWVPVLGADASLGVAVHHMKPALGAGETWRVPSISVAIHDGGWKTAMARYYDWVRTWYRRSPTPDWFRGLACVAGYMVDDTFDFAALASVADMVQLSRWWEWSRFDAFGGGERQEPWNPFYHAETEGYSSRAGGLEALRAEIARAHAQGLRVSLYLEGMVVAKTSRLGQARGPEWAMRDKEGNYLAYYCNDYEQNWSFCPSVVPWQEYLAAACARIVRETDCDAIYVDSVGMRTETCYHSGHLAYHAPGEGWYRGVGQLLRKVRQAVKAVKPEAAVLTEHNSCDVNTQWLDGTLSYAVQGGQFLRAEGIDLSPTGTSLFRFYFPELKMFEWPLGGTTDVEGYTLGYFNGNPCHAAAEGAVRQALQPLARTFREHREAFLSERPEPLVPTLVEGVYANRWPVKDRVVYTLYNATGQAVSGPVLRVPGGEEATYIEVVSGRELQTRCADGGVDIWIDLPAGGLAFISQRSGG